MNRTICRASESEWAALLRNARNVVQGRQIHEKLQRTGQDQETYLGNLIVEMYGRCEQANDAFQAFQQIRKPNLFSWTILVAAFARSGQLKQAKSVLDRMPEHDIVSWNAIISGYTRHGYPSQALHSVRLLDLEGFRPDAVTFISLVDACGKLGDLKRGKMIHCRATAAGLDSHIRVANSLLSMYSRCGCIDEAKRVFEKIENRDVISWNTMLAAFAQNGELEQALAIFREMVEIDLASWNTIITAFTQAGRFREALNLLGELDMEGLKPDEITFLSGLNACAGLPSVAEGRVLHASISHLGLESKLSVATSLINMYGKCGCCADAREIFEKVKLKDLILWNAMIAAYAQNGLLLQSLELVHRMDLEGLKKSEITHINVLSGFSHAGTFEDGYEYFLRMSSDHGVAPGLKHFSCMIDLLARSGKLDEAEELVDCLPFELDVITWTSLLAACKSHKDSKRAARIAKKIESLDSQSVISLSKFCVEHHSRKYVSKQEEEALQL